MGAGYWGVQYPISTTKKARPGGGNLVGLSTEREVGGLFAFYRVHRALPRFRKGFLLRLADLVKANIMRRSVAWRATM